MARPRARLGPVQTVYHTAGSGVSSHCALGTSALPTTLCNLAEPILKELATLPDHHGAPPECVSWPTPLTPVFHEKRISASHPSAGSHRHALLYNMLSKAA